MSLRQQPSVYTFEHRQIDLSRRELRIQGRPVPLGSTAFGIIEVLVRHAGELVTRHHLAETVWPGEAVKANAVDAQISTLRRALDLDRELVKTVSGRGYRLVGEWVPQPTDIGAGREISEPGPGNLPPAVSDLIGRDGTVRHVQALLSAHRLVTLTGPDGIGKTSLALEVARRAPRGLFTGCWFLRLTPPSDPATLCPMIAATLGLDTGGGAVSPDALARGIGDNKPLLVLDDCMARPHEIAASLEAVMRACPSLHVLATSRMQLRIEGEFSYRVPSLDIQTQPLATPAERHHSDAVQLFVAVTRSLHFALPPTPSSLTDIGVICRLLKGTPFAIRLAAAQLPALELQSLASSLERHFATHTGTDGPTPTRQHIVEAVIAWSHDHLPASEQTLLRRLSVFPATFTLEAAMSVTQDTARPLLPITPELLELVCKGLVLPEHTASTRRWRLPTAVRSLARTKLEESGEQDVVARRHAAFFSNLFVASVPAAQLDSLKARMTAYLADIDNVRAALDWAFSGCGNAMDGIVLTAGFTPVWLHFLLQHECNLHVQRALAHLLSDSGLDAQTKIQLCVTLTTSLLSASGQLENAETLIATAQRIADDLNDLETQLLVLWTTWRCSVIPGDYRKARRVSERFAILANRSIDRYYPLVSDRITGTTLHYCGDQTQARHYLERIFRHHDQIRDRPRAIKFLFDQRMVAQAVLARVLLLQGFPDQALHSAEASLEYGRAIDHKLSICFALRVAVCPVLLMTGDLAAMERMGDLLTDLSAQHDLSLWTNWGRLLEGVLLIRQGQFETGSTRLLAALKAGAAPNPEFHGILAEGLAGAGQTSQALTVLNAALAGVADKGQQWCEPELHRIKGEVLLLGGTAQAASEAGRSFARAVTLARTQDAPFWELRATLSLARWKLRQGRPTEAEMLLRPVYDRCTEGFETADMLATRALLEPRPALLTSAGGGSPP